MTRLQLTISVFSGLSLLAIACTGMASEEPALHDGQPSFLPVFETINSELHIPFLKLQNDGVDTHTAYSATLQLTNSTTLKVVDITPLGEIHWGYEHGGPEGWGKLSPQYATCSLGRNQSPIDITNAVNIDQVDLADVGINYQASSLTSVNNGHTIQFNVESGSSINVDGKDFNLLQFHFHAQSEHTIDGQHTAMEMHLVHKDENDDLAVLGVMMVDDGNDHPVFAKLWQALPEASGDGGPIDDKLDPATLLPENSSVYRYSGSLTIPPCSEGVNWLLLSTPISVSTTQVEAFEHIIGENNRPVQPLGARIILQDAI